MNTYGFEPADVVEHGLSTATVLGFTEKPWGTYALVIPKGRGPASAVEVSALSLRWSIEGNR